MTDGSLRQGGWRTFSGWPAIIGWAAMLIFTCYACTRMVAAGDTWVAMASGRHFVNHGVNTVEPFSVNSHKAGPTPEQVKTWPGWAQWITNKVGLETVKYWHPTGWVNQNWLTHVIFYKLTTALGSEANPYYDALVLWKFGIYIIAAACLYYTARIYGVHPALATVSVCFALIIGRTFFDIRPAGFSNLLVAMLILILALASYRNVLYVWLLVPLVIFWSNVHGGYIYAFIVLVPFVGWHAMMHLPRRWMLATYAILTWLVLWGMSNRFSHHEYLTPISLGHDIPFYLTLIAIAGSVGLAYSRKVSDGSLTAYHVVVSCVLFPLLLPRFFPELPLNIDRLPPNKVADLEEFIALSRLSYVGIFSFAMVLGAVVLFLKDKVVRVMEVKGILHTIAAGAVAFVAMVVFNPFHLTNLTHTFEISISKHAEQWRNVYEWQRAFNWDNPVGTAVPFLVMYILAWLVLIAWTIAFIRVSLVVNRPVGKRLKATTLQYPWPKIDLALLIIAAMTIYMAIRSRRFIPIAGFAACPVLALLIDQAVRLVAARVQFSKMGTYDVPALPASLRRNVVIASAVVVAGFGLVWGLRFKRVYLDPWPLDAQYKSVFMRMTASYSKPFEACEFIRRNKLSGVMYNYWTEGGAIAWGEEPDPDTGRIPLQLFMDGRAQAAYDVSTFDLWSDILSGGPIPTARARAGQALKIEDYIPVGNWISGQLREHGVWVVLMPDGQFDKPFTIALDYSRDWRTVYTDDKQKLFVDITSPKGAAVFQGMFNGQTVYPNEYLRNMALGHNLLMSVDVAQKKRGLECLVKALNDFPSPAPMKEMLYFAWQFPELRLRISEVCDQYVKSFEENKAAYARQDGYNFRLHTAWLVALARMDQTAKLTNNLSLIQNMKDRVEQCKDEMDWLAQQKKW